MEKDEGKEGSDGHGYKRAEQERVSGWLASSHQLFNWAVRIWRPRFLVELVRCAVRAACVCGRGRMKKENPWWCAIQRRAKSDVHCSSHVARPWPPPPPQNHSSNNMATGYGGQTYGQNNNPGGFGGPPRGPGERQQHHSQEDD